MTAALYYVETAATLSLFVTAGILLAIAVSPKGRGKREVFEACLSLAAFLILIGTAVSKSANDGDYILGAVKVLAVVPAIQSSLHIGAARLVSVNLRSVAYLRAVGWGVIVVAVSVL